MGATDVVPFIPLEGTTMEDCIVARAHTRRARRHASSRFPSSSTSAPPRRRRARISPTCGAASSRAFATRCGRRREPQYPTSARRTIHPTAGAVAIGARPFLVAYNVYLGPASNLPVAKNVAKAVRGSSGGLRYVKGLGLEVDGQAQVSMNLVDTEKTPLYRAYDMVKMEAEAQGVSPTWSEIVGLVPERALFETAARHIQLRDFKPEMVLEHKVRAAIQGGESLTGFVASVASPTPTPGGGSVAAHVGALGAALAQMVAGLTVGQEEVRRRRRRDARARRSRRRRSVNTLSALVARDADAYGAVSAAYKMPTEPADAANKRKAAITDALLGAAEVPLETARAVRRGRGARARRVREKGNTNAVSDAGVAALLAEAACRGAVYNVRINVSSLEDKSRGAGLVEEANQLLAQTREPSSRRRAVDKAIG